MPDTGGTVCLKGATASAIQLFERLPEPPVVAVPLVTGLLETSKHTAGKVIELLIAAGILAELGKRKRDRLYRYQHYLQLLEQRIWQNSNEPWPVHAEPALYEYDTNASKLLTLS